MKWRVLAALVAASFLALFILLIFAGARGSARDTLIFARAADSKSLDPHDTESGEDALVIDNIYEGLTRFDPDSVDVKPCLATEWVTSADGKTWEFLLRDGVRFHDGTPFDADAVVETFDRILREDYPDAPHRPYRGVFNMVARVEKVGMRKVRFELKQATGLLPQLLASFFSKIVSPAALRAGRGSLAERPVGTGPFRFVSWTKDEKIVLERNEDYWGSPPRIRRIILKPVRDPEARIQRLVAGEVDIVHSVGPGQLQPLRQNPQIEVLTEPGANVCYLLFNVEGSPPYNDRNFRLAVAHAVDRRKLIKLAYYGEADPAESIAPPMFFSVSKAGGPTYERNLERAREFLAKSTARPGSEVVLWHMNISRGYIPQPEKVAESIRHDLEEIGLKVRIESMDWNAYLELTKSADRPMALMGWMPDYADADNFFHALLHGEARGKKEGNAYPGTNLSFFSNPEFDRLVTQARFELSPKKREELYQKAHRIFLEELPCLPLVHVRQAAAVRKGVKYRLHPINVDLSRVEIAE